MIIGIILVIAIISIIVSTLEIKNSIREFSYNKNFIFTYITNSAFMICLVIHIIQKPIVRMIKNCQDRSKVKKHYQTYIVNTTSNINTINNTDFNNETTQEIKLNLTKDFSIVSNEQENEYEKSFNQLKRDSNTDNISEFFEEQEIRVIDSEEFHSIAIILMIVLYTGNVLSIYSLKNTSIFSYVTILGTSVLFTGLFKTWFYNSTCKNYKVLSLIIYAICFSITYFLCLKNYKDYEHQTLMGDMLVLFSAFFNSITYVLIQDYAREYKDSLNIFELVGYVGLYNFICIPFFLIVIMLSGYEKFELPTSTEFKFILLYSLIITIITGLSKLYSSAFLGPQLLAIGLAMIAPIMLTIENINGDTRFDWKSTVSSVFLLGTFIVNIHQKFKEMNNRHKSSNDVFNESAVSDIYS